jgi:hypothetical protein
MIFKQLSEEDDMSKLENENKMWNNIYKIGGAAALSLVLVGVIEIIINFLPGSAAPLETVPDWFMLLQENRFMGLRNLGLMNIFLNTLAIPMYFALYAAHRRDPIQPYAALTLVISFLGVGVFYATNRAFPMLDLSRQYATATTDAQRVVLEAAGQSMLSVGASHTPGTFLGFFLNEVAGIMISFIMLKGKVFSKIAAYAGIIGFGILLVFEYTSSFVSGLSWVMMSLAMFAGLLNVIWQISIARTLLKLGKGDRRK